jgi:hypothetical protein
MNCCMGIKDVEKGDEEKKKMREGYGDAHER